MKGQRALRGAFKRMEERPANNLPVEAYRTRQGSNYWGNWPDWSDGSDFPNWEDIGGPPPK